VASHKPARLALGTLGGMDAKQEFVKLQEQRAAAAARVHDLERKATAATVAAQEASAQLAEAERVGASAAKLHTLEERLAEAKGVAAQPWAERISGHRQRVRDCDVAVRAFVAGHLDELVSGLEEEGRLAAQEVNEAAASLIAAHARRERIASAIGSLITQVARPAPGDVSFSASEEAVPVLRQPWSLLAVR